MFVLNGAVTPRPSRECNITLFAKNDQNLCDSTVAGAESAELRWAKTRVFKTDTLACRNARFKNTSVSKWFLGPLLSNGRQRVGTF